jgi:hypothetical protein
MYTQLGWTLIPLHDVSAGHCSCPKSADCASAGKHPRVNDWVKAATDDLDAVLDWLERWPAMNLGLATGEASGVLVLDVDPDKGGADSLAALVAEHGPLPRTVQARTGSGGSHYLLKMPDYPLSNTAGKLGRGLDTRANGGQIVLAPSRSAKGAYTWVHAPWDTPIAEAPAWLLEELGRAAPAPTPATTNRGYFPPASAAVLEQARESLEAHGPAVDGEGGGLHTVHAAAILTHDFALTDEEAWPLLLEWNETCVPPWELDGENSLRTMLGRGRKYGKLDYGCRRAMDAVEYVRRACEAWRERGGHESEIPDLLALCRPMAASCGDPARHALIAKALQEYTGLAPKSLGLPKLRVESPPVEPGEIRVTTETAKVADQSLRAIAPHVFARNGVLCSVVKAERTFIHELETAGIEDLMSRHAVYVRQDENKGPVRQSPPPRVAEYLRARRTHPGVRVIEAVTTAPIFLADGSILHERGYNAAARVYLEPNVTVDVPEQPTRADAVAAVDLFRELLSDFRFAAPANFSAWLAALLSPLVKAATGNACAPLVCMSASSPGAGKSLLADLIGLIVTGRKVQKRPYNPRDTAEWQKRVTAFVKAAAPVNVLDNVNGEFGDETLEALLTSSTWSDRILGASDAPEMPIVSTWLATGNNIEPRGDTVRRVLMVRIEVTTDRPQERSGFRFPDIEAHVAETRAELLGAALTILRAYHCAGRPSLSLPAWGGFTAWSLLVRQALVWAGCVDPFETQRQIFSDLNEDDHEAHDLWLEAVGATDGSAAAVVLSANRLGAQERLGLRDSPTAHSLRRLIQRFVDKPRQGRCIRKLRDGNRTTYRVVPVSP